MNKNSFFVPVVFIALSATLPFLWGTSSRPALGQSQARRAPIVVLDKKRESIYTLGASGVPVRVTMGGREYKGTYLTSLRDAGLGRRSGLRSGDILIRINNRVPLDAKSTDSIIKNLGGKAILTDPNLPTGTDRIYEALQKFDNSKIDLVMNLQGDEPLMDTDDIKNLNNKMIKNKSQLGTLASKIFDNKICNDENVVKVTTKENLNNFNFPLALNFTRKVLDHNENIYRHLGIYCYQKDTLKSFVSYDQSSNELKSKLEQLRALDNNISINVALAKTSPIGVDTKEDFVAIKKIMEYKS